jgi:hypothetical protein
VRIFIIFDHGWVHPVTGDGWIDAYCRTNEEGRSRIIFVYTTTGIGGEDRNIDYRTICTHDGDPFEVGRRWSSTDVEDTSDGTRINAGEASINTARDRLVTSDIGEKDEAREV